MGRHGSAGEELTSAHPSPDAHHRAALEATTFLDLCLGIKKGERSYYWCVGLGGVKGSVGR